METLKVGMREFRENLAGYLESGTPLAIMRHGETVGYYIPAKKRDKKAELEAKIAQVQADFGYYQSQVQQYIKGADLEWLANEFGGKVATEVSLANRAKQLEVAAFRRRNKWCDHRKGRVDMAADMLGARAVALALSQGPHLETVVLHDPDRKVPFRIVNENTPRRYLTGSDFDIESIQRVHEGGQLPPVGGRHESGAHNRGPARRARAGNFRELAARHPTAKQPIEVRPPEWQRGPGSDRRPKMAQRDIQLFFAKQRLEAGAGGGHG